MSGHSKWATTKHKKAIVDAKRGKMFAKLIKNIEVAARMGGGDPTGNPTLYDAIQKAKKSSVPNDNIDRAVKRGSGAETGGADYQTIMYEGYGPAGVAMLIECLTDNKNRAAMEVRTAMTRNGGSLADPGSVSFLFNRKGVVIVPSRAGGQDRHRGRRPRGDPRRRRRGRQRPRRRLRGQSPRPATWSRVRTALQAAGIDYDSAEACVRPATCRSSSTRTARGQGVPPGRRRSRTSTTSRTSSRTSTSPTRSLRVRSSGSITAPRTREPACRGRRSAGTRRLALPPNTCSDERH